MSIIRILKSRATVLVNGKKNGNATIDKPTAPAYAAIKRVKAVNCFRSLYAMNSYGVGVCNALCYAVSQVQKE